MNLVSNLSPYQFPNEERLAAMRAAKGEHEDQFIHNPLAAHLGRDESNRLPGLSTPVQYPRRPEPVPVDRLESAQRFVSRRHINNLARRKSDPAPIEVVHYTDTDRYEVKDGNHRALLALKRGDTHVPALVTRTPGR